MGTEPCTSLHPLVLQFHKLFNKDLVEKYEFLRVQLDIATERHGKRFRFTDKQRCKLVKHGLPVKEHLGELCKIMKPETLLKWHREQKKKKWDYSQRRRNKVGRPPTSQATAQIVLRMAEQNPCWGCRTIASELRKLGHMICHTTVFNILTVNGLPLDPERKALSWKKFIESHLEVIWAADFFTEEVWTLGGLVTYYILFFVHLGSRRVYMAGVTPQPDALWMQQQARNFSMLLDDQTAQRCRYLIHDQHPSFQPFDFIVQTEKIKVVKTPKQSPWCNGYAERFVREVRDTLNNLVLVGEKQLHVVMKKIERHHNFCRPHQGLDNMVPLNFKYPEGPATPEQVQCHLELGGLLNSYYLKEAA